MARFGPRLWLGLSSWSRRSPGSHWWCSRDFRFDAARAATASLAGDRRAPTSCSQILALRFWLWRARSAIDKGSGRCTGNACGLCKSSVRRHGACHPLAAPRRSSGVAQNGGPYPLRMVGRLRYAGRRLGTAHFARQLLTSAGLSMSTSPRSS